MHLHSTIIVLIKKLYDAYISMMLGAQFAPADSIPYTIEITHACNKQVEEDSFGATSSYNQDYI